MLENTFLQQYKSQPRIFKLKNIIMQDNVPSQSVQLAIAKDTKLIKSLSNTPVINKTEKWWTIIKRDAGVNGKQYSDK